MDKISAILRLTFVMLLASSLTFAQYETNSDTQHQGQTNQGVQNNQDNQGTDMLGGQDDDDQFRQTAMTLAQDLQSRLTLTNDQVEEVTDILVDYKNEIADIKRDKSDESRASADDETRGTGTTETETDGTDVADADNDTVETGINGDNEMLGGRTDYAEKFREADVSANEDIEGVLEEEQLARYIQIKRDWWDTVKDRVHSAAKSENQLEDADDNEGILDTDKN